MSEDKKALIDYGFKLVKESFLLVVLLCIFALSYMVISKGVTIRLDDKTLEKLSSCKVVKLEKAQLQTLTEAINKGGK